MDEKFFLFIDESGTHSLKTVEDATGRYLCICGVLVSKLYYNDINKELKDIKKVFFETSDVVLHGSEIARKSGHFRVLADEETNNLFIGILNSIFNKKRFRIISPIIDKKEILNIYKTNCKDVYHTAVTFLLERVVMSLREIKSEQKSLSIIIESRNIKDNISLKKHINDVITNGTDYIKLSSFKKVNFEIHFKTKKDNVNGLQLADLFAFPILSKITIRGHQSYDKIKDKIYESKSGKKEGFGIKVFPKNKGLTID